MRASLVTAIFVGALTLGGLTVLSGCGDIDLTGLSDLFGNILDPNSVGDPNNSGLDPNSN